MANWIDREVDQLETDLENGLITQEEFRAAMRDLREEARAGAEDAAEQARQNYYDRW